MLASKAFRASQRANSTVEGPDRCVLLCRSRALGRFESARRSRRTSTRHLDRAASSRRGSDHSGISDGIPRRSPGDRRSLERFSKTCLYQGAIARGGYGYSLRSVATRSGPFNDGINKPRRDATRIASARLVAPSLANSAAKNEPMSAGTRPSIAPIWLVGAPCATSWSASRSEGVICKTGPPSVRRPSTSASSQNGRQLFRGLKTALDRRCHGSMPLTVLRRNNQCAGMRRGLSYGNRYVAVVLPSRAWRRSCPRVTARPLNQSARLHNTRPAR
jgi:hypothetical protein